MLVGRDGELKLFGDALDRSSSGKGSLLLLTGEAGLGKSTLLAWLADEATRRGCKVVWAAGWEAVDVPPLWIWDEVLKQISEPGAFYEPSASGGDPQMLVFSRIAERLSQGDSETRVLLLDDLHAADEDSLLALSYVASTPPIPAVIVGAVDEGALRRSPRREEIVRGLMRSAEVIPLQGLAWEDARTMIEGLGGSHIDTSTAEAVFRATEGNPLFIEEVVRMLNTEGDLHRPDHSIGFRVPAGVRGVVRSRAALLDAPAREVLAVASVIGKTFEVALLMQVLEIDLYDVLERLEEAVSAGFIEEKSALGTYAFTHILVREAFYEDLSSAQRMRLHHKIALSLDGEEADLTGDRLPTVAHHWFKAAQAGDRSRAFELSRLAAEQASAQGALEESERLFKRALQVADAGGQPHDAIERVRSGLAAVQERRGGAPEQIDPTPGRPGGYVFRPDGEFWTLTFEGRTTRLKDTKGLRYLAYLLKSPGREIHALDLVSLIAAGGSTSPTPQPEEARIAESDQPLLDERAKREYKSRLDDLREELQEAEANNDFERAARMQTEIDMLIQTLSSALGLGGRDRTTRTPAERARVNVTKVVREALKRIGAADQDLGAHLTVTVRTGLYLSYTPDPRSPVPWVF